MRTFGRHLLAAAGVGAVLLGSSYGYGRYRIQSLLRQAVDPSLEFASVRLEPDWSRLQLRGVRWSDGGEQRGVDRIVIERPVDILRSGRWRFDSVSLEGLQLQGFGETARKIQKETERRMRRHGLMLADADAARRPLDVDFVVQTAVARSQGRWTARLASAKLQAQQLVEATTAVVSRELPDANPLRGGRDTRGQFAELRRLESQLAAIDGGLAEDLDGWQTEAQRLRDECAEAVRNAYAAEEDHARRQHRERIEDNIAAMCDAYVASIVTRFLPPMAAAAELARTSHKALLVIQTPAAKRGADFFGLERARRIGVNRLTFSGSAAEGDRAEHFSGELCLQTTDVESEDVARAGEHRQRHGVVMLSSSSPNIQPQLRICGHVSNGVVQLTSQAVVDRFEASAETPTLPSFGLTLSEANFRVGYEDDAGRLRFSVHWRSPKTTVQVSDDSSSDGESSQTSSVDLQESRGSLEVQATSEGIRVETDFHGIEALTDQLVPNCREEKIAAAGAATSMTKAVESAISEMLTVRRTECRQIRGELARLHQTISARHATIAQHVGELPVRTASAPAVDRNSRLPIR